MKRKILVIDDERQSADFIKVHLQAAHYEVHVAYGGEEGLGKALEIQPDLVLLDLAMPRVDGLSVLMDLKKNHPRIKVIMLTACVERSKIEELLHSGADSYLTKPFKLEDLDNEVRDALI